MMPDDDDLFDWRRRLARHDDPETSRLARDEILKQLNKLMREVCIAWYERAPRPRMWWTDLDVNLACYRLFGERPEATYRHRRGDLAAIGYIDKVKESFENEDGERKQKKVYQDGSWRGLWAPTERGLVAMRLCARDWRLHPDKYGVQSDKQKRR